ncbi:hypothetical protein KSS87_021782 [Heliosperma pusillum]|nr:hypothetical protein KSS87_013665 [Heliosperma pusillum]KAH9621306.1 hypothetical protein KSS87_021782 [Heliosperma pusillum]
MYAVKGSWVGQTFALATASDSSQKKSRVRRSKEERKSMVETFIKRYQSSNDGSFPSLNLTHKEVGGSFYTVREMVREIIQENRVLGPARFSPEWEHEENGAAGYPLGSIAAEPQAPYFHAGNELNDVSIHQEESTTELTLDDKAHYSNPQDIESSQCASEDQNNKIGEDFDNAACSKSASKHVSFSKHEDGEKCFDVNETDTDTDGSQINGLSDETDKWKEAETVVSRSLETDKEIASNGACKVQVRLPTEEIPVETFPLKLENKGTDDVGTLSTDSEILNGTWNDLEIKPVDLTIGRPYKDKISSIVNSTDHVATKGTNGSQLSVSERRPDIKSNNVEVNGVVQHTECDPINEAPNFTDLPEIKEDTLVLHDPIDQKSLQSVITLETAEQHDNQSKNSPKGTTCLEERRTKRNDKEPPLLPVSGNNNRRDNKAVAASSPPVDRINLQSWERAALKRQPNPLIAIFKAFADALVKFWS